VDLKSRKDGKEQPRQGPRLPLDAKQLTIYCQANNKIAIYTGQKLWDTHEHSASLDKVDKMVCKSQGSLSISRLALGRVRINVYY